MKQFCPFQIEIKSNFDINVIMILLLIFKFLLNIFSLGL